MITPSDLPGSVPLLDVRDLVVEFRTPGGIVRAVDGVSFALAAGETHALLGESGSGKSVTALAVMGLVETGDGKPSGGRVSFGGRDLTKASVGEMRRIRGEDIAMIFQDPLTSLNPVFTVGYQIAEMFRRHRGASRRAARRSAIELMQRVHIPDAARRAEDYPHQFSGGMRQRVMIAMALALDPQLLIADEPTTALDVTVQAQIMELLAELQREHHMAMLLISHDLGVVADVASRVTVMYGGRVAETGHIRPVYEAAGHPYTRGLLAAVPRPGDQRERLVPIPGHPPAAHSLPSGCRFHPRCPHAESICAERQPPLVDLGTGHLAACHFAEAVQRGAVSEPIKSPAGREVADAAPA